MQSWERTIAPVAGRENIFPFMDGLKMQKSGGVRILMQLDFNEERFYAMMQAPALQPFAPEVISFLNKLSLRLLQVGRSYSDVITFAYWCRKAAVLSYAKEYSPVKCAG